MAATVGIVRTVSTIPTAVERDVIGVSIIISCVFYYKREIKARRFEIVDTNTTEYRRYDAVGRQLTVRLIPSLDSTNPVAHFLASVNHLIEHALHEIDDSDMVGMTSESGEPK